MKRIHRMVNRLGYHIRRIDSLTRLMNEAGSDKGWGLRGRHNYTRIYERLFSPIREKPITFVEIGLLRPDYDSRRDTAGAEGASSAKASSAPSLLAWRTYFPAAHIHGFDIDDFSAVSIPGTRILQGDMSNPLDLARLVEACPQGIDVLIDDGSHVSHHQQIAFAQLFGHINPGGLYIIEDCHWQDPSLEKATAIKTRDLFREFRRTGSLVTPFIAPADASRLAADIAGVRLYDSIEPETEDTEDALCVIRKKS